MASVPRILVVDDEPNMCRTLAIALADDGRRQVATARSGEEAMAELEAGVDLVVCDLSMPGMSGIEVLRRARQLDEATQVIMMTAYSTVQSAIDAMKLGAYDYLIKPFTNEDLLGAVDGALHRSATARVRSARHPSRAGSAGSGTAATVDAAIARHGGERLGEMVGRSESMRRLFRVIERAARSDATVLVTGESGTGKELIARAVHQLSPRSGAAFVAVSCASLADGLLESELFGHERGAFTGAIKTRVGRLEQAHRGTIFLDEIGEMSSSLQTKLLRVLQEREFERVGGTETLRVDLRVVAATHRDLGRAIAEGRFREDLYYRLNVVPVQAPPLRQRPEDLPLLAQLFLVERCAERGVPQKRLSDEAEAALRAYPFPGNVRELENLIERAVVLSDGELISVEDLPLPSRGPAPPALEAILGDSLRDGWTTLSGVVKGLERQLLERAIAAYPDRPNEEIARLLGTSRRVLESRLLEFGITKRGKS